MSPRNLTTAFNNAINHQDIDTLAALMSPDHTFVDSAGQSFAGKETALAAWRGFFEAFPDYKNHFEEIHERGPIVVVTGHSTCTTEALNGKAIWKAETKNSAVTKWQVYEDSPAERASLNLK